MPTFLTAGVILKKEDYKDYDRKLTIYTLGHGKITVLAKGAKKITSKLNSHLEFFSVTKMMVANSLAVKRLAGAQLIKKYVSIDSAIGKNIMALYFLEVINLLVKYDFKDDEVYEIIVRFFSALDKGKNQEADLMNLNKHLFALLSQLGYRPIIRAKSQKELLFDLNSIVKEMAEAEVKSFDFLIYWQGEPRGL